MNSFLQQQVTAIQLNNYGSLVILTAVAYDCILTFPEEIKYIWAKPWTRVSTLYVLARYSGLCMAIIDSLLGTSFLPGPVKRLMIFNSCEILNTFGIWIFTVFIGAADLAMILRVWILYKESRFRTFILYALLTFYAIEIVIRLVNCVMISTNTLAPVFTQIEVPDFSFCTSRTDSPLTIWTGIISDIVQIILGGLMCLLVGVQFIRQSLQEYRATKRFELGYYVSLLMREGLFYFLVILLTALLNVLVYVPNFAPDELWWWDVLGPILETVPTFTLTPRLILTLRKLYARVPNSRGSDTSTPAPFTSMDSDRVQADTSLFTPRQREGTEQGRAIEVVEREIPIAGPSRV